LDEVGDESIPRIACQQDNWPFPEGAAWNQIFPAQSVPGVAFGAMLEAIVRVNDARNSSVATVGQIKRKLPAQLVGKIGVKECAYPGPPAFGNGNEDGVATGKLAGAAAQVPSHGRST